MRAVVQRVKSASVTVNTEVVGAIETGLMVLLGIHNADTEEQVRWMAHKLVNLRIFPDSEDKMNLSLKEYGGSLLLVSQFTLYGDARKGFRPSFIDAARPETAIPLYEAMISLLRDEHKVEVQTGSFGAMMDVALVNWGPVTIIVEK